MEIRLSEYIYIRIDRKIWKIADILERVINELTNATWKLLCIEVGHTCKNFQLYHGIIIHMMYAFNFSSDISTILLIMHSLFDLLAELNQNTLPNHGYGQV